MRRAARVDANLEEVVKAFRKLGCSVNVRNDDMADLDVGYGGLSIIVEVKDGAKPPSRRELSDDERDFHQQWGRRYCRVVLSLTEALKVVGVDLTADQPQTTPT